MIFDDELIFRDALGFKVAVSSTEGLLEFCRQEVQFWEEVNDKFREQHNSGSPGGSGDPHFENLAKSVESSLADAGAPNKNVLAEIRLCARDTGLKLKGWLYSRNPLTHEYINCGLEYGRDAAITFYEYAVHQRLNNPSSYQRFAGYASAFQALRENNPTLGKAATEKKVLELLRGNYEDVLDSFREKSRFTIHGVDKWFVDIREKYKAEVIENQRFTEERSSEHDLYIARRDSANEKQRKEFSLKHKELMARTELELDNLKQIIKDDLKIKGPASYWRRSAKSLRTQGTVFSLILGLVIFSGLYLGFSLFEIWLGGKPVAISWTSLQGVFIFGATTALFGYSIRVLSRLVFSSFHLMRDAEEREQLAYFYLALRYENAVDDKHIEIVLQALFSRSESGLLGGESSPTMPTAANEITKFASRKG